MTRLIQIIHFLSILKLHTPTEAIYRKKVNGAVAHACNPDPLVVQGGRFA